MRITLLTGFHFQLHGVPSHDQGSPCQDSRILTNKQGVWILKWELTLPARVFRNKGWRGVVRR